MKKIEKLSKMIEEELQDAEKYARCALEYKESDPCMGKLFYDLSGEEMRHMSLLHNEVTRQIDEHKRTKGEPPATMLAIYNYVHEQQMERAHEVKMWQEMYRNG